MDLISHKQSVPFWWFSWDDLWWGIRGACYMFIGGCVAHRGDAWWLFLAGYALHIM